MQPERQSFFYSLAFKTGVIIILTEVVILALTGAIYVNNFNQEIDQRIRENLLSPAALINKGVLELNAVTDNEQMRQLVGEDLCNVFIIGINHNIFLSLNSEYTGRRFEDVPAIDPGLLPGDISEQVVTQGKNSHYVAVSPLFGADEQSIRFYLYLEADNSAAQAKKAANQRLFLLGSLVTVLATSVVILIAFNAAIFHPLQNILAVFRQVETGDLTARAGPANTRDELGRLQRNLNRMIERLQRFFETLEQRVAERTRELSEANRQLQIAKNAAEEAQADLRQANEALQERGEQLNTLINAMPDIVIFKDGQGRYLEANDYNLHFFGLESVDYYGKTDSELAEFTPFYHDALKARQEGDEIAWRTQTMSRTDEIISQPDGSTRIFDVIKVPAFYPDGSRKGLVVVGRDVTERKQAEEVLREVHIKLERHVEERTADLRQANKQLTREIEERKRVEEELQQNRAAVLQFSERLAALQEITNQLSKAESFDELSRRAVELGHARLEFDRIGIWFLGERLGLAKGSFGTDEHGELRDERGAEIEFGSDDPDWYLLSRKESIAIVQNKPLYNHLRRQVGEGERAIATLWEGNETIGLIAVDNLLSHQTITEQHLEILRLYATTLGHLFKRKQAEEELRKHRDHLEELVKERTAELIIAKEKAETANRAKSAFLASMSHELRTPLNAILGYAQILQRRPLAPEIIDNLHTVQKSGEHLLTLITDILDIAKIEAGRMELQPGPIWFLNFLDHITSIVYARTTAKQITFSFEKLSLLPARIEADETRLRQVLLNLLDNAVKFTNTGHVTLRVRVISHASSAPRHLSKTVDDGQVTNDKKQMTKIRFEVEDTGIGIPPEQLERIFQPFEQAGDPAHRAKGTGLGLAVSRQLVHLMGGDLQVESRPGRGSTFWFEVALPVTEVAAKDISSPEQLIIGYKGPRRTVLVVDDIASNRAVLADMLTPLGFDLIEAADGRQAVYLAGELRPDLILMDRWMPVLDGFEAARQIRQNPQLAGVPVIAISAGVSKEDQARSLEAGINAFLPKPVSWPVLAGLLARYLTLEWVYREAGADIHPSAPGHQLAELIPPPAEELEILYDLARRGDMRAIRERAAHIETLGEPYVPFACKLRELAKNFEDGKILSLVRKRMESE